MKKILVAAVFLAGVAIAMFAEYRYIMQNIKPYHGDRDTVYIEIFGQIDEYASNPVSELYNNR